MLCCTARVSKCVAYQLLLCQRQAYFLRSNSTSASHDRVEASADNTSQETTTAGKQGGANRFSLASRYPSTRTAHIRLWEPVQSIADVWVVKRAMEKKYGSILETYFHKDFEMPDRYQMVAYIIFRDPEGLKRIPEAGEGFTVLAPGIPKKPIHEFGVKDVEAYAGSDEFQPGFQFDQPEGDTTKRVIGGTIRRAAVEYCSNQEHRKLFQGTAFRTMTHFLNWGGFNPAKLDMSGELHELDLFKPDARQENTRMRAALQLCSRLTSSPIPQGVASAETIPEDQTVPTPGPSIATARIFAGLYDNMPSSAMRRLRKEGVDEEVDYEETVASSSPEVAAPPSPTLERKEPKPAGLPPSPSSAIPPSILPRPIKRPISAEERQKLESQLHAARQLQKAAAPVRRKQLKPAVIEPAKKPKPPQWQVDAPIVEETQERKGFLAKLAGLFGR